MTAQHHTYTTVFIRHFVTDVSKRFICSFTEFYPFCLKLYYFSTLKAYRAPFPA
jgi:hypothetical protein